MSCPICGAEAHVLETRWSPKHNAKRRRMQCLGCKFRFTLIGSTYRRSRATSGNSRKAAHA